MLIEMLLQEAVCYKLELKLHQLKSEESADVTPHDAACSLLADLQQQQKKEMQVISKDLENMVRKSFTVDSS